MGRHFSELGDTLMIHWQSILGTKDESDRKVKDIIGKIKEIENEGNVITKIIADISFYNPSKDIGCDRRWVTRFFEDELFIKQADKISDIEEVVDHIGDYQRSHNFKFAKSDYEDIKFVIDFFKYNAGLGFYNQIQACYNDKSIKVCITLSSFDSLEEINNFMKLCIDILGLNVECGINTMRCGIMLVSYNNNQKETI